MYGFLFLLSQSNHSQTLKPSDSITHIPDPVTQNSYLRTQLIPYICINKSIYQNEIFY